MASGNECGPIGRFCLYLGARLARRPRDLKVIKRRAFEERNGWNLEIIAWKIVDLGARSSVVVCPSHRLPLWPPPSSSPPRQFQKYTVHDSGSP